VLLPQALYGSLQAAEPRENAPELPLQRCKAPARNLGDQQRDNADEQHKKFHLSRPFGRASAHKPVHHATTTSAERKSSTVHHNIRRRPQDVDKT
jgi:hypothetical protein